MNDTKSEAGPAERKPSAVDVPTIESTLRYAETWLKSESGGDGMTHDQFIATCFASALQRLAPVLKAAATFVDAQGGLARGDFAADLFDDLARALEAAGR